MEAREEKLMMARASFQSVGSPKHYRKEKKKETEEKRKSTFAVRLLLAGLIFAAFVYSDSSKIEKINKISHKSFEEICKGQINLEKYSAILGKMW